jgi:hypothetical protein
LELLEKESLLRRQRKFQGNQGYKLNLKQN